MLMLNAAIKPVKRNSIAADFFLLNKVKLPLPKAYKLIITGGPTFPVIT